MTSARANTVNVGATIPFTRMLWVTLLLSGTSAIPQRHRRTSTTRQLQLNKLPFYGEDANGVCNHFISFVYHNHHAEKFQAVCSCGRVPDSNIVQVECEDNCESCGDDYCSTYSVQAELDYALHDTAADPDAPPGAHYIVGMEECDTYSDGTKLCYRTTSSMESLEESVTALINDQECNDAYRHLCNTPTDFAELYVDCSNLNYDPVDFCDFDQTPQLPFRIAQPDYRVGKCKNANVEGVSSGLVQGNTPEQVCQAYMDIVLGETAVDFYKTECACEATSDGYVVTCVDRCEICDDDKSVCSTYSSQVHFDKVNRGLFLSREVHCEDFETLNGVEVCYKKFHSLTEKMIGKALVDGQECDHWTEHRCADGVWNQRIDCRNLGYPNIFDFCNPGGLSAPFAPVLMHQVGTCVQEVDLTQSIGGGKETRSSAWNRNLVPTSVFVSALALLTLLP